MGNHFLMSKKKINIMYMHKYSMYNLSGNQVISLSMFPKNDKLSNMFHVLQKII
jgi:hypothetical protein